MQPDSPFLSLLAQPQWALLLFVSFWFGGVALIARMAGWSALARQFAASTVPDGPGFRFVSGSLGSVHWPIRYRNCLRIVVGDTGLYVALMFPFRFRSPALLLPWHGIESLQEKQQLATRTVTFHLRGQWSALSLPGPVGQLAKAAYEKARSEAAP